MGRSGIVESRRGSDDGLSGGLSGILAVREGSMIDLILGKLRIERHVCDAISWSLL